MTTTADLIAATERLLYSGARDERNYLAAGYTAGATTITIANTSAGIQAGARIAIDLEMFIVRSVAGTTVTVDGAQEGSAAANHANGAAVIVNPRYSRWSILQALNSELASLSSPSNGLYQMLTANLTYDSAIEGYDLGTSTFVELYEAPLWKETGSRKDWSEVANWRIERNMPTTDFASGTALFIDGATDGQTVRLRYKAGFNALATLTDDVFAVSGLPASAHDIPPYGAGDLLVTVGEVRRNKIDAQGDTKRATDVPAGAQRQAGAGLRQIHDRRVHEEAVRLRVAYPRRRSW